MSMERYEFKDGSSQKFWEVSVAGETLTVRFGKIGADGQTKEKTFDSAEAAAKEKAKLVKEKTGKGYAAVGGSAAPAPAKKAPALHKKADGAPGADADVDMKAAPGPATATIGVAPPPRTGERIVDDAPMPTRSRPARSQSTEESWAEFAQKLSTLADSTLTRLVSDGPPQTLTAEATARLLFYVQDAAARRVGYRTSRNEDGRAEAVSLCGHFAHWLVSARGAVFAMDVAEALVQLQKTRRGHYYGGAWSVAPLIALRAAITSAAASDYDAAVEHCLASPSADWGRDAEIAFVLADDRPVQHALQMASVLENVAGQGVDVGVQRELAPLIAEAPTSVADAWRAKRSYFMYFAYFFAGAGEIAATAAAAAAAREESPLPVLDWLLHYATDDDRTTIASVILDTHDDDALPLLAPLLHEKPIRAALDRASTVYPDWTFQSTLALLGGGRAEPALRARAMKAIEAHGVETTRAWAAAVGGRGESYYEMLTSAGEQEIAHAEDLPSFLRNPPWRAKKRASDDIVLQIEPKHAAVVFETRSPPEPPAWVKSSVLETTAALVSFIENAERGLANNKWSPVAPSTEPLPTTSSSEQSVLDWFSRRLDEVTASSLYTSGTYRGLGNVVHLQFEPLALMLWSKPTLLKLAWNTDWTGIVATMLARFGERAVPGLVKFVEVDPVTLLPCVREVETPALAPIAARAFLKLKKAREHGRAWLRAHPRAALLRLVPSSVGPRGEARDAAEYAVRFIRTEKPEILDAVITEYSASAPEVIQAVDQVLSRDPFSRTPSKVAKPPSWLAISALSRPQLKSGEAMSDDAVTAVVEMLSFVNPDEVYPGVPALREACTADSLARFAWDLFSAWLAAGAPSKEGWAFRAVGWLGDDECARQLTRLVRKWPGEAAHARAVTGLDVLADIGTDVALMNLNGIAEKVKFKGLQDRARGKIAAIAEARELSPEELADRLAPDLDLDARGGLDLDFGPRQFRAGFDEFLKPWVKDALGARLKDLPKPNKSDDADKAKAASARWSALKKDARAIASLQLARLETMLATGRRTKPDVFHTFFATHPLIRNLAQRLVWGVYDADKVDAAPTMCFRVGEDLSYTDADDNTVTIDVAADASGLIGLAHPLTMSADEQARWGGLFGDYEIAQPFPQLGRETNGLTEAEKAADVLTRFDGRMVESKRLRGMAARGWRTGDPQDGGGISWIERRVRLTDGATLPAMLHFEDGLIAGAASMESEMQTLREITLGHNYYNRQNSRRFSELDAVTASEVLRAVTLLVESQGA
jgi:predicted DNA-binding WGR domain protein